MNTPDCCYHYEDLERERLSLYKCYNMQHNVYYFICGSCLTMLVCQQMFIHTVGPFLILCLFSNLWAIIVMEVVLFLMSIGTCIMFSVMLVGSFHNHCSLYDALYYWQRECLEGRPCALSSQMLSQTMIYPRDWGYRFFIRKLVECKCRMDNIAISNT